LNGATGAGASYRKKISFFKKVHVKKETIYWCIDHFFLDNIFFVLRDWFAVHKSNKIYKNDE